MCKGSNLKPYCGSDSHLGDARAAEMGRTGEWNVGQLAASGMVVSGSDRFQHLHRDRQPRSIGRPGRAKESWPGNARRLGGAVSQRGVPAFLLTLPHDTADSKGLAEPMSEREPELSSHYVRCRLHVCHRAQYDPFPIYQGAQQSTVLGKVASFNDFRLGAPKANFRRDGPRRYRMTASYQADLDSGATARCDGPGDLWSGWFGNSQKTQEFQVLFDFAG